MISSQIMQLQMELQSATAERDLLSEQTQEAALETIRASASTLGEERDQLLEILQGLREEKSQMSTELEEKNRRVVLAVFLISTSVSYFTLKLETPRLSLFIVLNMTLYYS